MIGFDPRYFLFIAPALALSLWASWRTKSAFSKYQKVRAASGLTGAQAAQRVLDGAGIQDVKIVPHPGSLSDHFNLSEPVYGSASIAAIGVACHEAGHAIQHQQHYSPLWVRSLLVPTANIGSTLGYIVMIAGLAMGAMKLFLIGVALFSLVLAFQIVTLPVEFDASARAKRLAVEMGIVSPQEREGIDRVLNAAALTYVAAAVSTLLTLLYYLMRAGVLGGGRSRD